MANNEQWRKRTLTKLQLAKLTRRVEGDPEGGVNRLFRPGSLRRPHEAWIRDVGEDGLSVVWTEAPDDLTVEAALDARLATTHTEEDGILPAFAALSDAPAEGFLEFARQFAPLELCDHRLPLGHRPTHEAVPRSDGERWRGEYRCGRLRPPGDGSDGPSGTFYTPVEQWRWYAREVDAALRLAAALNSRKAGERSDWATFLGGPSSFIRETLPEEGVPNWFYEHPASDQDAQARRREFLAVGLDGWIALSGTRPVLRWRRDQNRPTIALDEGGVYGAVVRQIIFLVARLDGLAVCSGCGEPFTPRKRRPSPGRNSWCPDCGKQAADRQAQRKRRARLKREKGADDAENA